MKCEQLLVSRLFYFDYWRNILAWNIYVSQPYMILKMSQCGLLTLILCDTDDLFATLNRNW